ncbi:hypothetical protein L915_09141 [Phytophthora nicotianae]|uniref:Reverse transcriptase domain-containing protein n=2 Tax=Phytophthora nicotianae TaxID=4792 RepID=W2GV38_PHYNI|nr:hypothetical protein L915_09141 [Phytophthora nicotianae]
MDPMLFLSNSSHFGQNFKRTEGNAHVLVAIPEVHAVDPRYGKIQEALLRYVLLDEAVVKLAFSKPLRVARREITLPYTFDGFRSKYEFLVIDMNDAFDCISDMSWIPWYKLEIDWLVQLVSPEQGVHAPPSQCRGPIGPQFPCTRVRTQGDERKSQPSPSKPRREPVPSDNSPTESIHVLEYTEESGGHRHTTEVANPSQETQVITRLPGISWKDFLRDLKNGTIEQVCQIADSASASPELITFSDDSSARAKSAV